MFAVGDGWMALWVWGEENPEPFRECSWVDFRLIEVEGQDSDGPIYPTEEQCRPSRDGGTRDARKAVTLADGYLKWDGCMELSLGHHFCGRRNWRQLEAAMGKLYDWANERFGFEECE